jgi:hypothetical protein
MQSLGRIMLRLAATNVNIILTQPYTDTGILLKGGETVRISATGDMNWFDGSGCSGCYTTPAGQPWSTCASYGGYYFPGLLCWGMIGQIGTDGTPFDVGTYLEIDNAPAGELYLGVNDNNYPDNTGAWTATIDQNAKSLGACPCNSSYQGVLPSSAGDPENPGSGTDAGAAPSGYGGGSWGSGGGASARLRTNGNAGGAGPRAVTGDFSVDIATGNLFYEATDYTTAGQNPLSFTRYYNSRASVSGLPTYGLQLVALPLNGPMGADWRSNYERYLQITSTTVTAERFDGQQLTFTLSGGAWTPDSDIDITMQHRAYISL